MNLNLTSIYVIGAVCVLLVILIVYFGWRQGFEVFTFGASQRYNTEFSSTNQDADNIITRSFASHENFENMLRDEAVHQGQIANGFTKNNPNRFALDKAKVDPDIFGVQKVENDLQKNMRFNV